MTNTTERERLLTWAASMADPNWCLSVPKEAKEVIGKLVDLIQVDPTLTFSNEDIERAAETVDEFTHDRYGQCTPPKDAAQLVRDVIEALKGGDEE